MVILVYAALTLTIFLVVYRIGRMTGRRQGRAMAEAELPIRFRAIYLLEQRCPICDDKHDCQISQTQNQG